MTSNKFYHENDGTFWINGDTGGEPRKLGLLLPKQRVTSFARFRDKVPVMDLAQIRKIIDDPARKNGRKRFGPEYTKNQNGRGACNGYAEAGAAERARVRRGLEHIKLSGDFAYSQMNGGRDQGSMLDDGMRNSMKVGICSEDLVRKHNLRWEYRADRFPKDCYEEAERFKNWECYSIETEQELYTALALDFDCVVAVQAGGRGGLDQYGIVQWGNGPGNHSVMTDDVVYDARLGGLKCDLQNSWDVTWGDQGRCYVTFERQLRQTVNCHGFYAVRSSIDDPQGENPPKPAA